MGTSQCEWNRMRSLSSESVAWLERRTRALVEAGMTFVAVYFVLFVTIGVPMLCALDRTFTVKSVREINQSYRRQSASVRLSRAPVRAAREG
jgi:hypothetical protein